MKLTPGTVYGTYYGDAQAVEAVEPGTGNGWWLMRRVTDGHEFEAMSHVVGFRAEIRAGEIWRRKPAGYLYRVESVEKDQTFGSITLRCLHDSKQSKISGSGMHRKFVRVPEAERDAEAND